ncbi:hypothetical protein PPL_01724 [Heterostelium album PN500]|uniref:EGF-like domain-containing protein n=1 Tax=Heterostelium pallidum (strain ATCC 26659 / Pp 5 / PN500) TaxID=670386 RepID=D3B0A8_HETP5|nr:hypothetical protein PPL_01724 [Heterostelium album PN500]EFA84732.1 hypothetical protein PPL_01724 [Heterostelium album PN500]|eukprot:XP_020436844.1 hypothetical protein PPL_01724 [Heterostelium album PN500]
MNSYKYLFIILLFKFLIVIIQCQPTIECQGDYQCGVQPQALCYKGLNILPGIGLDETNQRVVIVGKFNGSSNAPSNVNNVITVPFGGGKPSILFPITTDLSGGPGYSMVLGLYGYLRQTNTPYIHNSQRAAPVVGPYHGGDTSIPNVWYIRGYNLGLYFDEVNKRTFYCDWNLHRVSNIPKTVDEKNAGDTIMLDGSYQNNRCNFLGLKDTNLLYVVQVDYANTVVTNISKIPVGCNNCSLSELKFVLSVPVEAGSFVMSNTHFYLGMKPTWSSNTSSGIMQIPINGGPSKMLTNDPVVSMALDSANTRIFYTTTNNEVKSVGPLGSSTPAVSVLYQSAASPLNRCACAPGFTGDQCQTCYNGKVRYLSNGTPQCVALLADGRPSNCIFDYECGNVPMAYCDGICACRTNFTGSFYN